MVLRLHLAAAAAVVVLTVPVSRPVTTAAQVAAAVLRLPVRTVLAVRV